MKVCILVGLIALASAPSFAQPPQSTPPIVPQAAPPITAQATSPQTTVIHYHVYSGGNTATAPVDATSGGERRSLFGQATSGCKSCGTTNAPAPSCGCGMTKECSGAGFFRNPCGYLRQRCAEMKEASDAKSCSYGKTLGDYGCSSCRLDCLFIFGTCHEFFDEPCRRGDPAPYRRY